jgi:hypothetical protein
VSARRKSLTFFVLRLQQPSIDPCTVDSDHHVSTIAIHAASCECWIIRCSALDVRTLAASVCFSFCKRTTCCSIVLCMTNRTTRTRRSCPIRYARRTACSSSVGFQPGSRIMTVEAAVKLSPRPPALVEIRKTSAVRSVRKRCTSASRAAPAMPHRQE